MGSVFIVGDLPGPEMAEAVGHYLDDLSDPVLLPLERRRLLKAWRQAPAAGRIDAMDINSIIAFLDYTAKLEGLPDVNQAIDRSRWRHLPYWLESCWVPLRSDATRVAAGKDTGGFPIFVGSAFALLDNLAEIASRSPYGLGQVPPHFELMRCDPDAFFALQVDTSDEPMMHRWIWRALFDGATLSIERNAPMWAGG